VFELSQETVVEVGIFSLSDTQEVNLRNQSTTDCQLYVCARNELDEPLTVNLAVRKGIEVANN